MPSSFPFLTEGFILFYKEVWLNFNCEIQKKISQTNTIFFHGRTINYDFKKYEERLFPLKYGIIFLNGNIKLNYLEIWCTEVFNKL